MKDNRLNIRINRPAKEILSVILNPSNTPLWIDSLVKEETNEWPVKVGTIYRNQNYNGHWNEYILTELTDNGFTMVHKDGNYHVKYTLTPVNNGSTDFEYYEWVNNGELKEPFSKEILQKLKEIIEK